MVMVMGMETGMGMGTVLAQHKLPIKAPPLTSMPQKPVIFSFSPKASFLRFDSDRYYDFTSSSTSSHQIKL